jgi:hypothetical protein
MIRAGSMSSFDFLGQVSQVPVGNRVDALLALALALSRSQPMTNVQ